MRGRRGHCTARALRLGALGLALASAGAGAEPEPTPVELPLELVDARFTGDLDGMIARRRLRVLLVTSKTFYFVDRGTQRGMMYEAGKALEEELNRGRGALRVEVAFVPVARNQLIPALLEGRGDLVAADLTVTPERAELVDFSTPFARGVHEVVVSGPASPPLASLDDLSGQEVWARPSSSYHASLERLGRELEARGKRPPTLLDAPEQLEDEDLLEMLNAGLLPLVVIDRYKAEFWAQVFPHITPREDLVLRAGADIALALRKNSPKLKALLDDFVKRHAIGTAFGNIELRRYLKSTQYVKDATSQAEQERFLKTIHFFQKYASRYAFDWLMLAAQGYQESRLDQSVRSPVGAIGVMQLMPGTGAEMKVGDIRELEANVHAGAKYMRFMMDEYFSDAAMNDLDRGLFAFASYNAGPARIARLRREAEQSGLDPNVWFGNVETVAARRIGRETVQYVSNIYKYYVAYKLVVEREAERARAREAAAGG